MPLKGMTLFELSRGHPKTIKVCHAIMCDIQKFILRALAILHQVVYSEIQPKTQGEGTSTEPDRTAEQTCGTGIDY